MATLINGNGNPRIYAAQDADLIAALAGDITGIAQIGNKFAATAVDANTISVADGVIVTKEGRRIQLDAGSTDMFVIPTGTTGVTNYYIIGYKLTTQSDDSQIAETFVQLMSSSSETITEDTFRSGATDVYVSLYRVQQNGVNLGTITGLLPELTNISELNNDLNGKADKSLMNLSNTPVKIGTSPYGDVYRQMFNVSGSFTAGAGGYSSCDIQLNTSVNIKYLIGIHGASSIVGTNTRSYMFGSSIFDPSDGTSLLSIYAFINANRKIQITADVKASWYAGLDAVAHLVVLDYVPV